MVTINGGRLLKIGFYEELDELRKEYEEADFGFLENEVVNHKNHAFHFLHGNCADFAAMLSEVYGYPIECIRYPGADTTEGKLIHAYCVTNFHGKKAYIDVRGITTDPMLFFKEFEDEVTYFPEDGSMYCTNNDGYNVEVKLERWLNKNVFAEGDYGDWTDEEIKEFIERYRDYYDVRKAREKYFTRDENTDIDF